MQLFSAGRKDIRRGRCRGMLSPWAGGDRGEQGPRRGKKHPLPYPGAQLGEDIAVEYRGGAAAARGSGVHVLFFPVVEQQPAVKIVGGEIHAVLAEPVQHDAVAQLPQVSGEDTVKVFGGGLVSRKKAERVS